MTRPVAVVTGAANGIGLEVARRLAATHRIALIDLDAGALQDAAASCGADALRYRCDITDAEQVTETIAAVAGDAGGIDVLVSNAGVALHGAMRHLDPDSLAAQLNVNVTGNWRVIHASLPHLEQRRGYLIGVASAAAVAPAPGLGFYGTSKAGLEMLLDVLRLEVAHLGIGVGCAYFLWIDTDMVTGTERDMEGFAHVRNALPGPLSKVHSVDDAAQAIVDGVHERARTVYTPGWLRGLSQVRMALRTRLGERDALAAAPGLDRLTAQRVAERGAFAGALRDTPAGVAAAESAGRRL